MERYLGAVLGVFAFLAVCGYWLVQMASGGPALEVEEVAWRALLALLAGWAAGLVIGRLGVAVFSEAWEEAQGRRREERAGGAAGGAGEPPSGGGEAE